MRYYSTWKSLVLFFTHINSHSGEDTWKKHVSSKKKFIVDPIWWTDCGLLTYLLFFIDEWCFFANCFFFLGMEKFFIINYESTNIVQNDARIICMPFLNYLFVLFADDITTTADGVDTYQIVKDAKRYKWVINYTRFDLM